MANRSRFAGWVDDSPAQPQAKPLPPLRHRISRTEKAFDELDALEAELYRSNLDAEDWAHLEQLIAVKREKLALARRKELGLPVATPKAAKPRKAPQKATQGHRRGTGQPMLTNGAQWLLFVAAMAIIFF